MPGKILAHTGYHHFLPHIGLMSVNVDGTMDCIKKSACIESKIAIPEEIACTCFDETTWSRLIVPAITVIEQPTYEIGCTAAELLIKRIDDPTRSPREVILKAKLNIRQSCGCHFNIETVNPKLSTLSFGAKVFPFI